jgi:serine/threonine protein kinase
MIPDKPVKERFLIEWDYEVHNCYTVVIADLGMGREEDLKMTEGAGTPLYRAPECDKGEYNHKADILSVGII